MEYLIFLNNPNRKAVPFQRLGLNHSDLNLLAIALFREFVRNWFVPFGTDRKRVLATKQIFYYHGFINGFGMASSSSLSVICFISESIGFVGSINDVSTCLGVRV